MRIKIMLGGLAVLVFGLMFASVARASTYQSSQTGDTTLSSVKDGHSVYSAAESVTLDTEIPGDVFTASGTLNIRKLVNGSVFAAAKDITVSARIGRSVRLVGDQITINDQVTEDATLVGSKLVIAKGASIGGDLQALGRMLELNGRVSGNVYVAGATININGTVDGNAVLEGANITIADTALISGDLTYYSNREATIAPGTIKGAINYKNTPSPNGFNGFGSFLGILMTLVSGSVIIVLARHKLERLVANASKTPLKDVGIGALVLFGAPIVIILLLMTIIALPLAFAVLVTFGLMLYVASVTVSVMLGITVAQKLGIKSSEKMTPYLGLLIGVILVALLRMVPYIGPISLFFITLLVIGMMTRYDIALWHKLRHSKDI